MSCFIFDEQLYGDDQGHNDKVAVCVVETHVKYLTIPFDARLRKEAMLQQVFTDDFIVQYENLSLEQYQILGIKKDLVRSVYEHFKGRCVDVLVPYAVGLRAYVNQKAIAKEGHAVIFIDDFRRYCLVTILEGLKVSLPRRLIQTDVEHLIKEIKRSQQKYMNERQFSDQALNVVVVSNHKELLSVLSTQQFYTQENLIYVDDDYPALVGMKSARFGMHFDLPEKIARDKRHQEFRLNLIFLTVAGGLLMAALIFFTLTYQYKNAMQVEFNRLQAQYLKDDNVLLRESQRKFVGILTESPKVQLANVYYDFVSSVPIGQVVKSITIQRFGKDTWQFHGETQVTDALGLGKSFLKEGVFATARVKEVMSAGEWAEHIELELTHGL